MSVKKFKEKRTQSSREKQIKTDRDNKDKLEVKKENLLKKFKKSQEKN